MIYWELYIKILKDLGIGVDNYHWTCKDADTFKKGYKALLELEKNMGILDNKHILVCNCSQKGRCLNPLHYNIFKKIKPRCNKDEVEDLLSLIDLATLDELGFDDYFQKFNTGNPIPARAIDFFVACNRRLTKAGKTRLDEEIMEKYDD